MKRFAILTLVAMLCSVLGFAETKTGRLEAFPGAEGYGRYTTGGRGGAVYKVTTLEDNDKPGSFRYACNQNGKRTIVFEVSGTIHLTSALSLRNGNVTIAGQTAPGDGICIADYPFSISASNVIIRFMRFRLGNKNVLVNGADGWDGLGSLDQKNIIVDHCSVSWSIDECLSFSGVENTTVQWCIVANSLVNSGHSKGAHGYGGNWGGKHASYHHNLMANHTSRAPRLGPRPTTQMEEYMDMRNNILFNYSGEGCYGGEGMNVNIVNNYYQPGPGNKYVNATGSTGNKKYRIAAVGVRTNDYVTNSPAYAPALHKVGTYYVDGNKNHNFKEVLEDNWNNGFYNQITWSEWDDMANTQSKIDQLKKDMKLDLPIEFEYTTTHSVDDTYLQVYDYVGACRFESATSRFVKRDAYDEAILTDMVSNKSTLGTGTGLSSGFINVVDDITYPSKYKAGTHYDAATKLPILNSTAAPKDSDGDGMPDEWETANGLNPNDASDGAVRSASGYTNLELYMNSLVQRIVDGGNAKGKMLADQLTYADNAVELPVFDISLYDPSQDPANGDPFEGGGDDDPDKKDGFVEVNPQKNTSTIPAETQLYSDANITITTVYNTIGTSNTYDYNQKQADAITFNGCVNLRGNRPTADNVYGDKYGDDQTPLKLEVKKAMKLSGYVRTGDNKKLSLYRHSPFEEVSGTSKRDERTGNDTRWVFTWDVAPGVYTLTEVGGGGRFSGFTYTVTDSGSGIEDILINPSEPKGNGKIYNVMGVEVKEPLLPGIYIRDGKKFLVK